MKPEELIAYVMEIRMAMHIVSETNDDKRIPKFDMTKDKFTKDHMKFLAENKDKIFSKLTIDGKIIPSSFETYISTFTEEDFVDLMNNAM